MTVDELKAEAEKLGYRVLKKESTRKSGCACGALNRYVRKRYNAGKQQYRCTKCGLEGPCTKTAKAALAGWNYTVSHERNKKLLEELMEELVHENQT